ncbi:MAG TPA: type II toxin-antitoxin system RelE/ParE family toxin [Desulfuromonadales bacterium]|nr:type II toxin-antitoxin system RelE/ParE family toxin [Desulfuromonadales bacterium]
MKIVFTPSARDQFLQAFAYIRRDKPSAAVSFRHQAEKVLLRLHDCPESGRTLPKFPDIHYREVIVAPYRFFYRVKDNLVWVVALWHGAQIPEEPADESANKSPS